MKENTQVQTVLPPLAPARKTDFLALRTAVMVTPFALAGLAGAEEALTFDVSSVKTSVMAILTVGVAIAIAFAIYKVGKRGTSKI